MIDLFNDQLIKNIISWNRPVNGFCVILRHSIFCFLWRYLKSLVYTDDALETNIQPVIVGVRPQMLKNIVQKSNSRMTFVQNCRGGHKHKIIFKYIMTRNYLTYKMFWPFHNLAFVLFKFQISKRHKKTYFN